MTFSPITAFNPANSKPKSSPPHPENNDSKFHLSEAQSGAGLNLPRPRSSKITAICPHLYMILSVPELFSSISSVVLIFNFFI